MSNKKQKIVNILIVDDDSLDVEMFRLSIEKRHFSNPIFRAVDGVEALEILRNQHEIVLERPYIILMDINMPRMNGLECIKEIRNDAQLKDAIIFVMTTSSHETDIYEAYNLNVAGYMVKSDIGKHFFDAINMLDNYFQAIVFHEGYDE